MLPPDLPSRSLCVRCGSLSRPCLIPSNLPMAAAFAMRIGVYRRYGGVCLGPGAHSWGGGGRLVWPDLPPALGAQRPFLRAPVWGVSSMVSRFGPGGARPLQSRALQRRA